MEQLRARMHGRLAPEGELGELLVDRVVAGAWRLCRLMRVEADLFEDERYDHRGEDKGPGRSFIYRGMSHNGDIFSKLSRYETSIERGMYKALHELQRLQAARRVTRFRRPSP